MSNSMQMQQIQNRIQHDMIIVIIIQDDVGTLKSTLFSNLDLNQVEHNCTAKHKHRKKTERAESNGKARRKNLKTKNSWMMKTRTDRRSTTKAR
jgi:hypothetical protein